MNAGKLNKYVEIWRLSDGVDDYGAPDPAATKLTEVWAERVNKSAKEVQTGAEQQVNHTVWRMWPTDIKSTDEIRFDGVVYRVNAVVADTDEHIMVQTTAVI